MSAIQTFSAQVNGTIITDYQLIIKNNDTNAILYDSTKVHLTIPLYDKSILNHEVPLSSVENGLNCKWILLVYENITLVTSGETFFKTYGIPTVVLTVPEIIDKQIYSFLAIYSHPQNITVKKFKFVLYDINDNVITDGEYFYHSNLTYTFDGFLNSNTYKVECIVIDQNDIVTTSEKQSFNVAYSQPNVNIIPSAMVIQDKSAIKVTWGKAIQTTGRTTGNVSYVNNFIRGNNKALSLDVNMEVSQLIDTRNSSVINPLQSTNFISGDIFTPNSLIKDTKINNTPIITNLNEMQVINNQIYKINTVSSLTYDVDIPPDSNTKFKIKFPMGFVGMFVSLGEDEYKVGYDGTKFYFSNKGSIFFSENMDLPTEPIYVVVRPTDVFISNIRLGF